MGLAAARPAATFLFTTVPAGSGRGDLATEGTTMRAPLTQRGAQRLREELEHLKSVKRPEIIAAIAEARAHGDLKENAEYHAAREMQSFTEGRIKQLESTLSNAQVIEVGKLNAGSRVVFGATVELADSDTDEKVTYQIVGDLESDIKQGLISISAPIARALIGKHEGDTVTITAPSGSRSYEIIAVRYLG
jgi:transcription elongation factor GreA